MTGKVDMPLVSIMSASERARLQKQLEGVRAKIRWEHLTVDRRLSLEAQAQDLETRLKGGAATDESIAG